MPSFPESQMRNNSQCILKNNCEKSENRFSMNRNRKSDIGIRKSEIGNKIRSYLRDVGGYAH